MEAAAKKREQIRNMKIPEVPPSLDINIHSVLEESGRVMTNVINRDNNRTILREYPSKIAARKTAVWIANTIGITGEGELDRWLDERGFDTLHGTKYTSQAEIVEINDSVGNEKGKAKQKTNKIFNQRKFTKKNKKRNK